MELAAAPGAPSVSTYLKADFVRRTERNSRYSLRAYARDLGLSHTHLGRVLSQQKRLSMKQALAVSQKMKLDPAGQQRFMAAVAESWLGAPPAARPPAPERAPFHLEMETFRTMSRWYHTAILEMLAMEGASTSPATVARQLGITPAEVRAAVNRLLQLGLVERRDGKLVKTHAALQLKTEFSVAAVRAFHRDMIGKALVALESEAPEDFAGRDITGSTVVADPRRIPEAKRRIAEFRLKMMAFLSRGAPTSLYQLNVQLFPLVKGGGQ